jgi:uncharacterized protein (DUF433 family)
VWRATVHSRYAYSRYRCSRSFAAGLTSEQILEEMPDLETEDLKAALQYAARKLDHPVLAA